MHLLVTATFNIEVGFGSEPVSIWCDHFPNAARHLLHIELIRLLIVACGMLSHSSSMAVWSCWILVGTGTRCRTRRSRASQTCLMGDMSGEYTVHGRTGTFTASRNCVQILATWGRGLSCWNTRWRRWMNGTTTGLRISVHSNCHRFKMQLCLLFVVYARP